MPKQSCPWPGDDPAMIKYHDTEWGVASHDDRVHFEFLVLAETGDRHRLKGQVSNFLL